MRFQVDIVAHGLGHFCETQIRPHPVTIIYEAGNCNCKFTVDKIRRHKCKLELFHAFQSFKPKNGVS